MEEEEEKPDDNSQLNVNTNRDCWGRLSGERTKLITVFPFGRLEVDPELDQVFEISDREPTTSEMLGSSMLHEATPPDRERDKISPDSFSFWDGLIRFPTELSTDTTGDSEGNTRTRTDTLDTRGVKLLSLLVSWDDLTVIVTSCTVFRVLLLDLKGSLTETLTREEDTELEEGKGMAAEPNWKSNTQSPLYEGSIRTQEYEYDNCSPLEESSSKLPEPSNNNCPSTFKTFSDEPEITATTSPLGTRIKTEAEEDCDEIVWRTVKVSEYDDPTSRE
jgi:hypothetical protein